MSSSRGTRPFSPARRSRPSVRPRSTASANSLQGSRFPMRSKHKRPEPRTGQCPVEPKALQRGARSEDHEALSISCDRTYQFSAFFTDGDAEGAAVLESLYQQHAVATCLTLHLRATIPRAQRLGGEIESYELRHVEVCGEALLALHPQLTLMRLDGGTNQGLGAVEIGG